MLAIELEFHCHHSAGRAGAGFAVSADRTNPRVLEDRYVEPRGVFGLAVEPQERRDGLHALTILLQAVSSLAAVRGCRRATRAHRSLRTAERRACRHQPQSPTATRDTSARSDTARGCRPRRAPAPPPESPAPQPEPLATVPPPVPVPPAPPLPCRLPR